MKEKVFVIFQMTKEFIMENGKKINGMEKEQQFFQMEQNMKENGKIINEMEMVYPHGKMEIVMKVIILMMNSMEKEHI